MKSEIENIAQMVMIAKNTLKSHSEIKNLNHNDVNSLVKFINNANSLATRKKITNKDLTKIFNIAKSSQNIINKKLA